MADQFKNIDDFRAALRDLPMPKAQAVADAADRNGQLTKPPGALGQLEDMAIWYAGWVGNAKPSIKAPQVVIFAGNHGVTAQGVSAFPAEVTVQMVGNFSAGGAAINQLCKAAGSSLDVIALDLDHPTEDFTKSPAMTDEAFLAALNAGWNAVDPNADLFCTGEMGIGNTTSAAAIAAAVCGGTGLDWVGRGTGVDDAGLAIKTKVVDAGLERHAAEISDPVAILQCLGGRELAAMAAAILRARHLSIPVIMDGFICTAAASTLFAANSDALDHVWAGHLSAEGAHKALLDHMEKTPMLSLGLRLGEGSGAALAINILKSAVACHSGMATFAEAGVAVG